MDVCTLAAKCGAEAIEENRPAIPGPSLNEASMTEDEHRAPPRNRASTDRYPRCGDVCGRGRHVDHECVSQTENADHRDASKLVTPNAMR